MKKITIIKIMIDIIMLIILVLLMGYYQFTDKTHQMLGKVLVLIFIVHNLLNLRYYKVIFKGQYKPLRICGLIVNLLLWLLMIGNVVTGIISVKKPGTMIVNFHSFFTMWTFILISIHIGLNIKNLMNWVKKRLNIKEKRFINIVAHIIVLSLVLYGIFVIFRIKIYKDLFFIDNNDRYIYSNLALFILDYISMMLIFVSITYHFRLRLIKRPDLEKKNKSI